MEGKDDWNNGGTSDSAYHEGRVDRYIYGKYRNAILAMYAKRRGQLKDERYHKMCGRKEGPKTVMHALWESQKAKEE